ncbi:MAG: hypothetical protein V3S46_01100 [Nitrospinota bacterium]
MRSLIVTIIMAAAILASCGDDTASVSKVGGVNVSGSWWGKVYVVQTTWGTQQLELTVNINQDGTTITGGMGVSQDQSFSSTITGTIDGNDITATTATTNDDAECANWNVTFDATVIGDTMRVNISGRGCSDLTGTYDPTEPNYISASDGVLTLLSEAL